jgi:hypothetical protein
MIQKNTVDPTSVVSIIRGVGEAVMACGVTSGALDIAEAVIQEVAKGRDGIVGTEDDLIPSHVVELVGLFVKKSVVRDFASWSLEGLVPPTASRASCLSFLSCLPWFAKP